MIPDYIERDGYDQSLWTIQFTLCSVIQLLIYISYNFLQKITKKPKVFFFVVQFQRRKPHSKLLYKTLKKPPMTKRPPKTDGMEQLTLFRENRPAPPTSADFLPFRRPTTPQNRASRNFCLDSSIAHTQICTQTFDQKEAQLPVSKTWFPIDSRESTAKTPKNSVKPWAPPPHKLPRSYEL